MSSASRSSSTPEFFIDRRLGRHIVPDALRAAGLTVHTMADVYGEKVGQALADEDWLRDAGLNDWVVLMKDAKIRYRPPCLRRPRRRALAAPLMAATCPGKTRPSLDAWMLTD